MLEYKVSGQKNTETMKQEQWNAAKFLKAPHFYQDENYEAMNVISTEFTKYVHIIASP